VNLPLGVVGLFVLAATLPSASERVHHAIDYLGTALLAGGLAGIVLATSLGGTSYAWGSTTVVGLAVGGVVLLVAFALVERRASEPVLPPRLFRNRVFAVTSLVGLIIGFALFGAITYLPLFLQVVKGATPTGSGLQLVPLMGGLLVTSIASGQIITRTGRYKPFPIAGTGVMVVGLYLLSTIEASTSQTLIYLFMFVLGLGLGMVMQVLVLAVQNAVDYSDLGVATSGATLFRSIGGSLGTATLGAIFANRLNDELHTYLPTSVAARAGNGAHVNPQQIARLPTELRGDYLHAFTNSLSTVFLVASGITVAAFAASWFIRQLPLRETVGTGDLVDTYAAPRDSDSLAEVANMIGRLDRREGAREILTRVAARAGVDLGPAACWLLARLSHDDAPALATLAHAADINVQTLSDAEEELREAGLIASAPATPAGARLTEDGQATLARLTSTGEQRLADLLEDWRPEEHEELARLIATLAREFFIDPSELCRPLATA
jgi:DNA-binding MarR family transcriptional regulator